MVDGKKVVIVTQARIGSSRFPKKIVQKLGGKTLIDHHLDRLLMVTNKDKVIIATTKEAGRPDPVFTMSTRGIPASRLGSDIEPQKEVYLYTKRSLFFLFPPRYGRRPTPMSYRMQ